MPKSPVLLTEGEKRTLEDLCTSNDKRLNLRAEIILMYASSQSAQVVAREIGINEKTVYKWVSRYQKYGLDGLRIENPGTSKSDQEKTDYITKQVIGIRDEGVTSAKDIATALGVSVSAVYRSFDRAGISTNIKLHTKWSYSTVDQQVGNSPYLVGIFLSHAVKYLVLCETSEQLKGKTIHGEVSTRDKNLYKEMEQSAVTLRMVDTLVAARNHIGFIHVGSEAMANRFLTETIDDWPEKDDYRFHVIAMGSVRYTGTRMRGIHYSWAEDVDSWMDIILQPFFGMAHADEYEVVVKDLKVMKSYIATIKSDSDPYVWRMVYGDYSPLNTILTAPEETDCIGDDFASFENAVKTMFPIDKSGVQTSGGTRVGSVIVMQDSNGQLTYKIITEDALLPEINDDVGTPEGFEHMINDLDRKMTVLSHKVNLEGRELYLTNIKKKAMH